MGSFPIGLGLPPAVRAGALRPPSGGLAASTLTLPSNATTIFNGGGMFVGKFPLSVAQLQAIFATPVPLIVGVPGSIFFPFLFYVESQTNAAGMSAGPSLRLVYDGLTAAANSIFTTTAIGTNNPDRYNLIGAALFPPGIAVGLSPPAANCKGMGLVVLGNQNMTGGAGAVVTVTLGTMLVPGQV